MAIPGDEWPTRYMKNDGSTNRETVSLPDTEFDECRNGPGIWYNKIDTA